MISDRTVRAFVNAARALMSGVCDTGLTSNGLRKLDFTVKIDNVNRVFTALEQNPDKLSTPAKLAKAGHAIVQIRDNGAGLLVGNVDVEESRFNSYEAVPQPIAIEDIEDALGDHVVSEEDVQVASSINAIPVDRGERLPEHRPSNTPGRDRRASKPPRRAA